MRHKFYGMKKIIVLFLLITNFSFSQTATDAVKKDTSYWKKSGFIGLNFSQTALSNWQGGGEDNFALNAILNLEANYKKDKIEWNNKLDAQYGIIKPGTNKLFRKNIDQIFAVTKFNVYAFKKYWFYSLTADFRSQLTPGYNYVGDSIAGHLVSNWAAPAYIQLGLGLDYKPADYFSASLAPIAGKITIVNDQILADAGSFGVDKATYDTAGVRVIAGKKVRYEFGGRFTLKFKKDLGKNVNVDTYFDLFSNYLHNPGNIDVVWNTLITFKINKFLTATLSTKLLYDDDVIIKYDWNKDGKYDNKNDINGPRVQVMSSFGLGLGYKF